MRLVRITVVLFLVVVSGVYYLIEKSDILKEEPMANISHVSEQKDTKLESKEIPEERKTVPLEGSTYQWMNTTTDDLISHFGEPQRKDPSAYGYEWWLYTDEANQFIQFGIEDNQVKSIYALGDQLSIEPAGIGQAYNSADNVFSFSNDVTSEQGSSSYTYKLTDEELKERPLVKVTDDIFLQLYFDTFTDELAAVRVVSADILLSHQPYELHYRGELPQSPDFNDDEWAEIESGAEQQIYHITNVIRSQYGKPALEWDETVSQVAYLHSEDMAENHYFSHYTQNGDGLKERLDANEVFYQSAGENIAAQYPDAQAALHGWLNSEGHREALLNDNFTHLGVGVYHFYYTQNFLKQP